MPKHLTALEVNDSIYYGRIVKIKSNYLENDYKLSLITGDTHEEFMSYWNSRKSIVKSKFGNGEYRFISSNEDFKIYWVEFRGENYNLPVSSGQFEFELQCLNHNRLQIHQIESLEKTVEILKAQGLRSEAQRINKILSVNRIVQNIRDIKFESNRIRTKLIGK